MPKGLQGAGSFVWRASQMYYLWQFNDTHSDENCAAGISRSFDFHRQINPRLLQRPLVLRTLQAAYASSTRRNETISTRLAVSFYTLRKSFCTE
jgi:hypothetical protein